MTHSMTQEDFAQADQGNDSIEIVHADHPYRHEPLPRAKPHERITRGMDVEKMFGLLAEAIDDEFLEIVLGHRGKTLPREFRS